MSGSLTAPCADVLLQEEIGAASDCLARESGSPGWRNSTPPTREARQAAVRTRSAASYFAVSHLHAAVVAADERHTGRGRHGRDGRRLRRRDSAPVRRARWSTATGGERRHEGRSSATATPTPTRTRTPSGDQYGDPPREAARRGDDFGGAGRPGGSRRRGLFSSRQAAEGISGRAAVLRRVSICSVTAAGAAAAGRRLHRGGRRRGGRRHPRQAWFTSLTPARRRGVTAAISSVGRRLDGRLRPRRQRLGQLPPASGSAGPAPWRSFCRGRRPAPRRPPAAARGSAWARRTWCQISFSATLPSWKGLRPASRK